MTSPNTPVDVEAMIASLAGVSVTACRQVPGVVAELCLSSAHGVSRLLAERREMLEALKPFAAFAEDNTERDQSADGGEGFGVWAGTRCEGERIVDWFGPTDFRRARAAILSASPEGKGE